MKLTYKRATLEDNMNTPTLETARLILRRFTENDMEALILE